MSRILIASKVPKGDTWLSDRNGFGDYIFREVCRKVRKAFTENQESRGHFGDWGEVSTIDDFVVLRTTPERAEELTAGASPGGLWNTFLYRMDEGKLHPEKQVVVVETYGKNSTYSDFVKWRVRNAFGKIIDDGRSPNGFELSVKTYDHFFKEPAVRPASANEVFYLCGSASFKREYLAQVPPQLRKGRITEL